MTAGSPPSTTATTEFVVPRSMPITFAMSCSLLSECLDRLPRRRACAHRASPPAPVRAALRRFDLDLLRLVLFGLRKLHREHPVPIGRLDLLGVDRRRQREGTLELAVPALPTVAAPLLDIGGPLPLTLDRQQVVGQGEMNVLLAEPRQLGGDHDLVLGLVHVRRGGPHPLGRNRLAEETVEETAHLRMHVAPVTGQLLRERAETNQRHGSSSWCSGLPDFGWI